MPPSVAASWDANTPWAQAMLFGYEQVRQMETSKEENERFSNLVRVLSRAFA